MVRATYTYPGEEYNARRSLIHNEQIDTAIKKINSLYNEGIPLYRKKDIEHVSQQLEKVVKGSEKVAARGQKITVRGLDGTMVDFEVESGRILHYSKLGFESVLTAPFISHLPVQVLTSHITNYIPRIAYCNLRIHHRIETRDEFTKEPVSSPCTQPINEVERFFRAIRTTWDASKPCKQLQSVLKSKQTPQEVRNIIAFACGSMAYGSEDPRTISVAFQHALILTLQGVLEEKAGSRQIMCYSQDPGYTEVDKAVLETYGIAILDDPKAFLKVDESSVIISCAPSIPVKQIVSDLARPAMMIWDKVSDQDAPLLPLDPDTPRLREYIHKFYDSVQFPENSKHFGNLVIYIRRTA